GRARPVPGCGPLQRLGVLLDRLRARRAQARGRGEGRRLAGLRQRYGGEEDGEAEGRRGLELGALAALAERPVADHAARPVGTGDGLGIVAWTTRCWRSARVTSLSDGLSRFSRMRE